MHLIGDPFVTLVGNGQPVSVLPTLHSGAPKYTPILNREQESLTLLGLAMERVLGYHAHSMLPHASVEDHLDFLTRSMEDVERVGLGSLLRDIKNNVSYLLNSLLGDWLQLACSFNLSRKLGPLLGTLHLINGSLKRQSL